MSTGYGWEGISQVCATLLGARHVSEHLFGGSVYLWRYNKCSTFLPFTADFNFRLTGCCVCSCFRLGKLCENWNGWSRTYALAVSQPTSLNDWVLWVVLRSVRLTVKMSWCNGCLQYKLVTTRQSWGVWYSGRGRDLLTDRYVAVHATSHAVCQRQNLSTLPGFIAASLFTQYIRASRAQVTRGSN